MILQSAQPYPDPILNDRMGASATDRGGTATTPSPGPSLASGIEMVGPGQPRFDRGRLRIPDSRCGPGHHWTAEILLCGCVTSALPVSILPARE